MANRRTSRGALRPLRPTPESLEGRALLAVAFDAETLAAAGQTPSSITSGDINDDGIADLIETDNAVIALRIGRGDGTFLDPTFIDQAGFHPASVAIGDFNGDGRTDLVVMQDQYQAPYVEIRRGSSPTGFTPGYIEIYHPEVPSTIQFLANQGDGTFRANAAIRVNPQPKAIAAADLDGDGKLDLVVNRTVILGRGDGTFGEMLPIVANDVRTSNAIVLADLDGDGKLDLVESVARSENLNGQVDVRLGHGDGTFGDALFVALDTSGPPGYVYDNPGALVVADFDGDGRPDLAVIDHGLHTLMGRGNGTFGGDRVYDVGPGTVAVTSGDFDHDSHIDLAVTTGSTNAVTVVRGQGDGTFEAPRLYGLLTSISPLLADLDGDNILDLAYLANILSGPSLVVRQGLGDGSFGPSSIRSLPGLLPSALAAGDLNGDGKLDLVVTEQGLPGVTYVDDTPIYSLDGNGLLILHGRGDRTFDPPLSLSVPLRSPSSTAIADIDGDGRLDLVELYHTRDGDYRSGVGVWLKRNDGNYASVVDLGLDDDNVTAVTVADLNGDGKPDLALTYATQTNAGTGHVSIRLNQGTVGTVAFGPETTYATGIHPVALAVADLDGDGTPDLVVANQGVPDGGDQGVGANVVMLRGAGGGSFLAAVPIDAVAGVAADSVTVADLDRDGHPDLVIAFGPTRMGTGIVDVLHNQAAAPGTFALGSRLNASTSYAGALVADLNGDGQDDILSTGGSATAFLGAGGGLFITPSSFVVAASPTSLVVADFNRDGRPDLATIGTADGTGTVLINATPITPYPFTTQGTVVGGVAGNPIVGTTLATIVDTNPSGHATDFRATIDWGDGTQPAAATIVPTGPGTYAVVGSHTYVTPGLYPALVSVRSLLGGESNSALVVRIAAITDIINPPDPPVNPGPPDPPVTLPPLRLLGVLNPSSDGGASSTDRLTGVNTPNFYGFSEPGATVQLYVRRITPSGAAGFLTLVGQVQAGADGSWSITSVTLADGPYAALAVATKADGRQTSTDLVALGHPLTIDTAGPRILDVRVDPQHGRISITYFDPSGMLDASGGLANASAYLFRRGIARGLQKYRISAVQATGGASPLDPVTVTLTIRGGRKIEPGLAYLLRVDSDLISDRAGNALDAEFSGTFPTGNGHAGGDFAAALTVRRRNGSARPVQLAYHVSQKGHKAAKHPVGPRAGRAGSSLVRP